MIIRKIRLICRNKIPSSHPIFDFVRDHAGSITSLDIYIPSGPMNEEIDLACCNYDLLLRQFHPLMLSAVKFDGPMWLLLKLLERTGPQLQLLSTKYSDESAIEALLPALNGRKFDVLKIPAVHLLP